MSLVFAVNGDARGASVFRVGAALGLALALGFALGPALALGLLLRLGLAFALGFATAGDHGRSVDGIGGKEIEDTEFVHGFFSGLSESLH